MAGVEDDADAGEHTHVAGDVGLRHMHAGSAVEHEHDTSRPCERPACWGYAIHGAHG